MKNHLCSCGDEDEYESTGMVYCWWRSAAKYDECTRLKLGFPNSVDYTPRFKLLRELGRLDLAAQEDIHELRYKLQNYRSGDFWVPTGGLNKEDMDIPPVATILLVGFSHSGKSSLVNLMYSVIGRSGLMNLAQTSGSVSNCTKMHLQEHNVMTSMKTGFCVFDSRGFNYGKTAEAFEELTSWMSHGVSHNQLCLRSGDDVESLQSFYEDDNVGLRSSSKYLHRRVNSLMVVVNIAEVYKASKAGNLQPLEATRDLFCFPALRKCNENPILILTHGDLLTTEERIDGRLKLCQYLGVSETNGVYDIVCLTNCGFLAEESDPVTAYSVAEAVYRALLISDRGLCPKRDIQDWIVIVFSWVMCLLGDVFAFLAELCMKLGGRDESCPPSDKRMILVF